MLQFCDYLMANLAPSVLRAMSGISSFGSGLLEFHETQDFGIRFLLYPEHTPSEKAVIRCGEHVDSSTFTVLLQDRTGGLQVRLDDQWHDMYDEMLVITGCIGDILTNHRSQAVRH